MQAIIMWLDENANAVMAAASVITMLATVTIAWASWVSSRLLRWEKEKDRRSRQPVLVLTEELEHDRANQYRALYVENIGYGPALNIVRTVLRTGTLTQHVPADQPLPLRPLGQKQQAYAFCATLPNVTPPMLDEPAFAVRVECDDVFGNHYEMRYENRRHTTKQIAKRETPVEMAARI